jgi:putative ABC transport system permease protein
MIKNYFKTSVRHLGRNKLFSLINISGLAIGISASLVIYLIVQHEWSYEKFQKDGDRIFRVVSEMKSPVMTLHNSGVPVPTAKAVREEVTGLENVTHFITAYDPKVSIFITGNQSPAIFRNQKNIIYADEQYFNLFKYDWLAGSPQSALKDPFQVVLTQSRAKTYFASLSLPEILGREIFYNDSIKAVVSGIVKDLDHVTDFTFKEFISRATLEHTGLKNEWNWDEWGSINSASQMFVKLAKKASQKQIENQLNGIREKYKSQDEESDNIEHLLQALTDIHFNNDYDAFNQRKGHKSTLFGLFAVAVFLLLLGCINFINLTTAQSSRRAKEIGIKKTMGSGKSRIIFQFLGETFFLTLLATILSVAITPWLLNIFSDFIPEGISFTSLNSFNVWIFLLALLIVVSVLSGFYPALLLTRFSPVTVLKNQANNGTTQTRKAWLRKTLTVTQFIIAQFLIIATLVVSKQIRFSLSKDLGYKKDAIVYLNTPWNFFSDKPDYRRFALYDKLKLIPEIEKVSLSGSPPASNNTSTNTIKFSDGVKKMETRVEVKYADTAYFNLYQMKLLAGRNLQQSDTTKEFVINETYARVLGFLKPEEAVGRFLDYDIKVPIVGVIADFNAKSTHQAINPLIYSSAAKRSYSLHIALKPGDKSGDVWKRALVKAEQAYKEIYPDNDFTYSFYDESIASFYKTEQNVSRLLKWASGLCIFISCLGLLGLAIFITNTRTKEIGVRKVLGASIVQIVSLLSKDFISLVLIAFVITLPLSWWATYNWLQDFAYRTTLSWWVFAVTGTGMVILSLLILSIRTIKSASVNPVKSLRTE